MLLHQLSEKNLQVVQCGGAALIHREDQEQQQQPVCRGGRGRGQRCRKDSLAVVVSGKAVELLFKLIRGVGEGSKTPVTFVAILSRNPQYNFPKMRGGGDLETWGIP